MFSSSVRSFRSGSRHDVLEHKQCKRPARYSLQIVGDSCGPVRDFAPCWRKSRTGILGSGQPGVQRSNVLSTLERGGVAAREPHEAARLVKRDHLVPREPVLQAFSQFCDVPGPVPKKR